MNNLTPLSSRICRVYILRGMWLAGRMADWPDGWLLTRPVDMVNCGVPQTAHGNSTLEK